MTTINQNESENKLDAVPPDKKPDAAAADKESDTVSPAKKSFISWLSGLLFDPGDKLPARMTKLGGVTSAIIAVIGAIALIIFNFRPTATSFSVVGADRGQIVLKVTASGPANKQAKVSNFELTFGDLLGDLPIKTARLRTTINDTSIPATGLRFKERIGLVEPTPPPSLKVPLTVDGLRTQCRQKRMENLPDRYTKQEIAEMIGTQTVTLALDAEESNGSTHRISRSVPAKFISEFIDNALPDVMSRVTCP